MMFGPLPPVNESQAEYIYHAVSSLLEGCPQYQPQVDYIQCNSSHKLVASQLNLSRTAQITITVYLSL